MFVFVFIAIIRCSTGNKGSEATASNGNILLERTCLCDRWNIALMKI